MGFLIWLMIGLGAGYAAGQIMKGERPYGLWGDLGLGILGALVGGFLLSLLGFSGGGIIATFITALAGACVLIWGVRQIKK